MKKVDLEQIKKEKKTGVKFSVEDSSGKIVNCEVVTVEELENGGIGICYVMGVK